MRTHPTPFGPLTLAASTTGLTVCSFADQEDCARRYPETEADQSVLDRAQAELDEYFAGERTTFSVPVDLRHASPLHRKVLKGLDAVGYGQTTSYGRLARSLGLSGAGARTVGGAMAANPVLVVVPCHRVLGADGALVGYAGGLPAKRGLLDLESASDLLALEF